MARPTNAYQHRLSDLAEIPASFTDPLGAHALPNTGGKKRERLHHRMRIAERIRHHSLERLPCADQGTLRPTSSAFTSPPGPSGGEHSRSKFRNSKYGEQTLDRGPDGASRRLHAHVLEALLDRAPCAIAPFAGSRERDCVRLSLRMVKAIPGQGHAERSRGQSGFCAAAIRPAPGVRA